MSSYQQVTVTSTIGQAMQDAERELESLWIEMGELCAEIAAQFPNTYEKIAKYQEALLAHNRLLEATALLKSANVTSALQQVPIALRIGRQTRQHKPVSQRVRLGNVVVRLTEAAKALKWHDDTESGYPSGETVLLKEIVESVQVVTFPKTYG